MRNMLVKTMVLLMLVSSAFAVSFTDTDKAQFHGKTGLKELTSTLDANFALLEAAGWIVNADISASAAIAHSKLAAVAPGYLLVGNSASQAVAVAVSGDITMATNGVVTVAATVVTKDSNRLLTEGYFDVVDTTQLVFIASGVTNVIDADITTP